MSTASEPHYHYRQLPPEYNRKLLFSILKTSYIALIFVFGFLYLDLGISGGVKTFLGVAIFLAVTFLEIMKFLNKYSDEIDLTIHENYLNLSITNLGGNITVQLKPDDILRFSQYSNHENFMHFDVTMRNPKYNLRIADSLFTNSKKYIEFVNGFKLWLLEKGVEPDDRSGV